MSKFQIGDMIFSVEPDRWQLARIHAINLLVNDGNWNDDREEHGDYEVEVLRQSDSTYDMPHDSWGIFETDMSSWKINREELELWKLLYD